jgi:N-ethylmaleimide reductase
MPLAYGKVADRPGHRRDRGAPACDAGPGDAGLAAGAGPHRDSLVDPAREPGQQCIRLAPLTTLNGCVDADPETTYLAAARLLGEIGVGYIHIAEADWDDAPHMPLEFKQRLRAAYPGTLIYAGKYDGERARAALAAGWADLIAFGRPFVANPDLPERLRSKAALNLHQRETLFGGGARGLTDYPALA